VTLHVRRFGEGPRKVLALHCSLAHGGAWAGMAAHLPGVTVVAPDLPGHGRSPDWDGRADLHTLTTRECLALLPPGPVDLFGHSFGATVALRMAVERPEAIRTLTLIEPVLFAAARAAGDPAWAQNREALRPFAEAIAEGDRSGAAAAFHEVWGAGLRFADLPAFQRDDLAARIHLIPATERTLEDDAAGLLAWGRLESVGVPVLLLEGATSPPVIAAIQTELQRRLPQVTRAVVPGAGHMAPITHPPAVAALIAAHIA
jgi:pimeloyl-ACP methyl ester carboxylesterase